MARCLRRLSSTIHSHQLQLIVPSLTRQGDLIDDEQRSSVLFKLHSLLYSWSGGFIQRIGAGHWLDANNTTVIERITTLEAYGTTPITDDLIEEVISLILIQLDQDSVALVVNGTLQLYNRFHLKEHSDARSGSGEGKRHGWAQQPPHPSLRHPPPRLRLGLAPVR